MCFFDELSEFFFMILFECRASVGDTLIAVPGRVCGCVCGRGCGRVWGGVCGGGGGRGGGGGSEEHTSELKAPVASSYAVFCLKKKTT